MKYVYVVLLALAMGAACGNTPTEPTGSVAAVAEIQPTPRPGVTAIPKPVVPMPPRLSITGGCDSWNPWTPVWVVTNSGGPTASLNDYWNKSGWIYYTVSIVGFPGNQMEHSFNMTANSSTNIGSFLFGTFNPHYTLRVWYGPTGADISNTVDCSAGVPKATPTPVPPTPTPRSTPTPTPGPCPPGPGGGCK